MKRILGRAKLGLTETVFAAAAALSKKIEVNPMQAEKTKGRVYEFEMNSIDGKPVKLSKYKGHPLLIVNTASLCGFTPQYTDLEALFQKYKDKGLRIAAFPANEFGAQEPGSDADIKSFCLTKFSLTFDLYSKISVKGPAIHPLYKYLTTEAGFNGDIPWNFSKYLVNKEGLIVARFGPDANPVGKEIMGKIEALTA
ncbi:MAG: glutathione peroxidase [Elusimicrobia bacterium]|nr:glutathione peroxidase [Elusimicrobiota bacterium]